MDIFEHIINGRLEEVTAKQLMRKQRSITRLFPSFPDRVKAVADKGGIRLNGVDEDQWHFRIHSGTKDNVWYDAYVRYNDLQSTLRKTIKDRRLWVKDKSRIDKRKMARKMLNTADIQLSCSCPADKYYGGHYIRSLDKYNAKQGDRETRPPKKRNPKQYGAYCKHLENLMKVLPFYMDTMMRWLDDFYGDDIKSFEDETRKEYGWFKKAASTLQKRTEPDEDDKKPAGKKRSEPKDRKRVVKKEEEEPEDKKKRAVGKKQEEPEPEDTEEDDKKKEEEEKEERKARREKDREDREEQKKKDKADRGKEKSEEEDEVEESRIVESSDSGGWVHPNGEVEYFDKYSIFAHEKDAFAKLHPGKYSAPRSALDEYMELGNIRFVLTSEGELNITVATKPTSSQMQTVGKWVRDLVGFMFQFDGNILDSFGHGDSWIEFVKAVRKI